MIRRLMTRRLLLVAAAGVVATVVGVSLASAGSPASVQAKRLHFLLREQQQVVVDRAPKGPSSGDVVLLRGDLLDPATRSPVGSEVGYCMGADNVEGRAVCTVVLAPAARTALAKADTIYLGAVFDNVPQPPQISAITGGTGVYRRARGQVVATDGPAGLVDLVFTLEG
jgi:hypothetical protein